MLGTQGLVRVIRMILLPRCVENPTVCEGLLVELGEGLGGVVSGLLSRRYSGGGVSEGKWKHSVDHLTGSQLIMGEENSTTVR